MNLASPVESYEPCGLKYLIAEGVLPHNPAKELYKYEKYYDSTIPDGEEEVLWTDSCVLWCQRGLVRRFFRYNSTKDQVTQTTLTWFNEDANNHFSREQDQIKASQTRSPRVPAQALRPFLEQSAEAQEIEHPPRSQRLRALVVIIGQQAHIYSLSGLAHTVNLKFDVDRICSMPIGLVLQRITSDFPMISASPVPPTAPFNSFVDSQSFYIPSSGPFRTLANVNNKTRRTSLDIPGLPGNLADLARGPRDASADNAPRIFALTDPISAIEPILEEVTISPSSNMKNHASAGFLRQAVSRDEELLYVSGHDELQHLRASYNPLIFIMTLSRERKAYSLWHANYTTDSSISPNNHETRRKVGSPTARMRASLASRKSMMMDTPTAPKKRAGRESLNKTGRDSIATLHGLEGDAAAEHNDVTVSEEFDAAIAAAFESPGKKIRADRRTSSILARAELSTYDQAIFPLPSDQSAYLAASSRRISSGPLSRALPSGSSHTMRRSIRPSNGADVTMLDSGIHEDNPQDEDSENGTSYSLRRELVMTRILTRPLGDPFEASDVSMLPIPGDVDVFTIHTPADVDHLDDGATRISIFVINRTHSVLSEISIRVKLMPSNVVHGIAFGGFDVAPDEIKFRAYRNVLDAVRVADGPYSRGARLTRNVDGRPVVSLLPRWTTHDEPEHEHSARRRSTITSTPQESSLHFDSWNIPPHPAAQPTLSTNTGRVAAIRDAVFYKFMRKQLPGQLALTDEHGRTTALRIKLYPHDTAVKHVLAVSCVALSSLPEAREIILSIWRATYQKFESDKEEFERPALRITILYFVLGLLGFGYDTSKTAKIPAQFVGNGSAVQMHSSANTTSWAWLSNQAQVANAHVSSESSSNGSHLQGQGMAQVTGESLAQHVNYAKQCLSTTQDALPHRHWLVGYSKQNPRGAQRAVALLLVALHLLREEAKLNVASKDVSSTMFQDPAPLLAQIGYWLGWDAWNFEQGSYYDLDSQTVSEARFDTGFHALRHVAPPREPPSIYDWLLHATNRLAVPEFPKFEYFRMRLGGQPETEDGAGTRTSTTEQTVQRLTPRIEALTAFVRHHQLPLTTPQSSIEEILRQNLDGPMLETLPEAIMVQLKTYILRRQTDDSTTHSDLSLGAIHGPAMGLLQSYASDNGADANCGASRNVDARQLCTDIGASIAGPSDAANDSDILGLVFRQDNRFKEASTLLNSRLVAVGEYLPKTTVDEAQFLDEQKAFAQELYKRTISLSAGEGLLSYCSRKILPTQKIETPIFNTSCNIQPSNITVDVDKTPFGEDKAGWAYFHAGASAGLLTGKGSSTVDTSWLVLNKPNELGVRHAGLLLSLGLNGHLKKMARWLAFKYLTPKHEMTTIGLLLGLSASQFGTMDSMVTRLLSLHIPRLLPQGSSELNLSSLIQTAAVMGVGLLYAKTQHRRMSEMMLSELENMDVVDNSHSATSPASCRDEGYRLATGFALGFINLGKGKHTRSLHGLHLVERLLSIITGPREIEDVHILDQASAGATMALALMYMKTHDAALAAKIEVPNSLRQLDYSRPDILLLRTVAKHLIMWDDIHPTEDWICANLPTELEHKNNHFNLRDPILHSANIPLHNILAGLCWAISLKYAGTADPAVIMLLLKFYSEASAALAKDEGKINDHLWHTSYDARLSRAALTRFHSLLGLATATVAAGTGDLYLLRFLRVSHATVGTPYNTFGVHQSTHMALGALFLGQGRYSFGTNDVAVASLLCAFYPLYPKDAMDNEAHLQAFRHFWTFAAEPRCLIARDADTKAAVVVPVSVVLRDGTEMMIEAPKLLPELDKIARLKVLSDEYSPVVVDFADPMTGAACLAAFKKSQTVFLKRKSLLAQHPTGLGVAMVTLDDDADAGAGRGGVAGVGGGSGDVNDGDDGSTDPFDAIFSLPIFEDLGIKRAEAQSIYPRVFADSSSSTTTAASMSTSQAAHGHAAPLSTLLDPRTTGIDDLLSLAAGVESEDRDRLMGVKMLLKWADAERAKGGSVGWIGEEGVEAVRRRLVCRMVREGEDPGAG